VRKTAVLLFLLLTVNIFAFEHLTMQEYPHKIKKGDYIIDFYAPWCPPCRVEGEYLKMVDRYKGVKILKVNIDESSDLASLFGVTQIPTLVFIKDAMIVNKITGLHSVDSLKDHIEKSF